MAISSIEHRSSWYDIFDARGKKTRTLSDNIGELLGWSDRFFIVRRAVGMTLTTNRAKKSKQFLQTLATMFLSALISLL